MTRFYCPSSGAAAVSPARDAGWDDTDSTTSLALVTTRINSAMTNFTGAESSTTNAIDVLVAQFVSAPLSSDQTITGTAKGQFRTQESSGAANFASQMILRVVSNDGSTVRGVSYAGTTEGTVSSEWSTSASNRKFPRASVTPVTLTSVGGLTGDRIVIELGFRAYNTSSSAFTGTIVFGDNQATDLAENESVESAINGWVEYSQTLTFSAESGGGATPARSQVIFVGI